MAQVRPYRGVEAADRLADRRSRLLEAGLTILGSDADPSELTVRGVCRQAGITARYFYESFNDKDDLVGGGVRLGDRRHRRQHRGGGRRGTTTGSEPRGHGEHRADHRGRSADRPPAVQLAVWPTRYWFASAERQAAC